MYDQILCMIKTFLLCLHRVEGARGLLSLFYKATNHIPEGPTITT